MGGGADSDVSVDDDVAHRFGRPQRKDARKKCRYFNMFGDNTRLYIYYIKSILHCSSHGSSSIILQLLQFNEK